MDGQDAWAEKGRRELKRASGELERHSNCWKGLVYWLRRAYGDVEKGPLVGKEGLYRELVHSKGLKDILECTWVR